jgi:hypothetical protein
LNESLDRVWHKRGMDDFGAIRCRLDRRHQRLQCGNRGLIIAQRDLEETQDTQSPPHQRVCAAAMPGCQRLTDVPPRIGFAAAVGRDHASQGQPDERGEVAAELQGPFHGVIGNQRGFSRITAPNRLQHRVKADEDQFAVATAFRALAANGQHLLVGALKLARPAQQQCVLHVYTKVQGDVGAAIFSHDRLTHCSLVKPVAAHKSEHCPHAPGQTDQTRTVKLDSFDHRVVNGAHRGGQVARVE